MRRQNNGSSAEPESLSLSSQHRSQLIGRSQNFGVKEFFTYADLEHAAEDFNQSNQLGVGASGKMFSGVLRDGRRIAVKRIDEHIYNGNELFMTEVQNLAEFRHPNIVNLYGCSSRQSPSFMIVYEYIGNGTVHDHLHGDEAIHARLPWNTRMNIAVKTANALKYLHHHRFTHRNIKSSNILLNADLHVKLRDFGLSFRMPNGLISRVSTDPQGTIGYMDPEYCSKHQLSLKSDVFSFGVVMMELISSFLPYDITRPHHYLSDLAKNIIENDALDQLVDQTLGFDADPRVNQMITGVAALACRCLNASKDMRPSINDVLKILEAIQSCGQNAF